MGPSCFLPMPPLNLFKLASQFVYNKGKGGLDKGTEQEARIRPKVKVAFETKYILRMVSAVVINAWRTEQACSLLRPFLITNPNPSIKQLRRVLSELTVQDFTFSLAKNLLKTLICFLLVVRTASPSRMRATPLRSPAILPPSSPLSAPERKGVDSCAATAGREI